MKLSTKAEKGSGLTPNTPTQVLGEGRPEGGGYSFMFNQLKKKKTFIHSLTFFKNNPLRTCWLEPHWEVKGVEGAVLIHTIQG